MIYAPTYTHTSLIIHYCACLSIDLLCNEHGLTELMTSLKPNSRKFSRYSESA